MIGRSSDSSVGFCFEVVETSPDPRPLVPVWVVQDDHGGNFLGADLQMHLSLADAGKCFSRQEALDTAVAQLGFDYVIHQFWVMAEEKV